MKIDVVYKLGSGSKVNNVELKYSLRSLSNFIPLGKVYVIGFKPDWVKNIIHIPAEDCYTSNKDANLINKLIIATFQKELSDEFVNISDDQVFLKECSYEEISLPYYDNKLTAFNPGQRLGRWQTRLDRTIRKLKELSLPFDCYETHIPCLLNKDLFIHTLFKYDYGTDRGYCGNTLYYNTIGVKGKELKETTLARILDSQLKIEDLCINKQYLNYTDKAINDNLLLFLHKKFPEKSKYEV